MAAQDDRRRSPGRSVPRREHDRDVDEMLRQWTEFYRYIIGLGEDQLAMIPLVLTTARDERARRRRWELKMGWLLPIATALGGAFGPRIIDTAGHFLSHL